MTDITKVPLIIRGEIIDDYGLEFGGRHSGANFRTADVSKYMSRLALSRPSAMGDMYQIKFSDIADYLVELGEKLHLQKNSYLQDAFRMSCSTSGLSESILRAFYESLPATFNRQEIYDIAELSCGIDYLDGWVEKTATRREGIKAYVRAFGARAVHVVAGNHPGVSAMTVIRNAITRSDAIIKTPSNDPLTAAAIARTMIEMAPVHPLTRHLSVAYWKGGNEAVEAELYDPRKVEKIVAWGGFNSIKHITKYLQPGIDLITLDPKLSSTIIGKEAFADEGTIKSVARRLALDIGTLNQEGCVNARVIYVQSGTDDDGIERCKKLAESTFDALQNLPPEISTPHKEFDPELRDELDALKMMDDDYAIFGGSSNEGATIVSYDSVPVDFSRILTCRVANLVPIDDVDVAVKSVTSYTQTVGIYPDSLKADLRNQLSYQGAQRLVSLGGAVLLNTGSQLQDGIEPIRRMCKWITDEYDDGAQLEAQAG